MAWEQRRLAAIMAVDVAGFSRLMGQDESGTLARLKVGRAQHFEPALARHGGRLAKLTGDGALAEFGSAADALAAAIEFQEAMATANRRQLQQERLEFRVGLHLGDLIVDGEDLYGDSINVAARLQGEAPAGGIILSASFHEAVAGRLACSFEDLGPLTLKHIDRSVRAFRVKWDASDWTVAEPAKVESSPTGDGTGASRTSDEPVLALPGKPSVAVLPFTNMSDDTGQEYFADGMTDEIITALSRFHSLFVIARNSTFAYKGRAVDVRAIGRELGVRYVLAGSVRRLGDRLRIIGQLVQANTGVHIWARALRGRPRRHLRSAGQGRFGCRGRYCPEARADRNRARCSQADRKHRCLRHLSACRSSISGRWKASMRPGRSSIRPSSSIPVSRRRMPWRRTRTPIARLPA